MYSTRLGETVIHIHIIVTTNIILFKIYNLYNMIIPYTV